MKVEQNEFSLKRLKRVPIDLIIIVCMTKTYKYMICESVYPASLLFPFLLSELVIFAIFTNRIFCAKCPNLTPFLDMHIHH